MYFSTQMKTLLITEVFPPKIGGTARWFWEIYRAMPREQVVILAGEDPRQNEFDQTHDLHVVRIPLALPTWGICSFRGLRGYVKVLLEARRMVRQHAIGHVHCGKLLPEGWIGWLLNRIYGLPYLCYMGGEELNLGVVSRELGWMMRRVLRRAEYIIPCSRNTSEILQSGWNVPADRIRVLYPGVDIKRFVPVAENAEIRAKLDWHDRPVVLTVGRLQERKGQDQLIRALKTIRQTVPNVLYSIVGDGEERTRLEALVMQTGLEEYVQFRGEIDDEELIQCYQQCDLFVLPNREVNGDIEGFGMVLLEAQACGKPVVAGASGGTAETMRVPETGRIVPCDGPDELAKVVIELLNNPALRKQMGKAARQWTVDRFSWESLSRQAYELFNEGCPQNCLSQLDHRPEAPTDDGTSERKERVKT